MAMALGLHCGSAPFCGQQLTVISPWKQGKPIAFPNSNVLGLSSPLSDAGDLLRCDEVVLLYGNQLGRNYQLYGCLQVSIEERALRVKGAKWNTSDDFCVLHRNIYFVS